MYEKAPLNTPCLVRAGPAIGSGSIADSGALADSTFP